LSPLTRGTIDLHDAAGVQSLIAATARPLNRLFLRGMDSEHSSHQHCEPSTGDRADVILPVGVHSL
jgi:hypothetical protein